MSEFLFTEATVADLNEEEEEEEDQGDQGNDQESSFIDDNTVFSDQTHSNYRFAKGIEESSYAYVTNVSISYDEAMILNRSEDYEYEGGISNFLTMILFLKQMKNLIKLKSPKVELKNLRKALFKNAKKAKIVFLMLFCGERILKLNLKNSLPLFMMINSPFFFTTMKS